MARYSKLIAALLGNAVAILLAYLATNWPAIATCGVVDGVEACNVLGFSQAQITAALMLAVNSLAVYAAPKNSNT